MTNSQTETTTKETTTTRSFHKPAQAPRIEVTDPAVADSLNKKTVGIRQLGDVLTLQRLKRQNALNQQLVADAQATLRRQQGLANGSSDMTNVEAGAAAADDQIQIGDTSYNINVAHPEQLQQALDALKDLQDKQNQNPPQAPVQPGPTTNTTITTPPGTPIQVNPVPQPQQPQQPQVITVPREKTTMEKLLPWALLGTTALAAGGLGYALSPKAPDTNTQYKLEFDETAGQPADAIIPTPSLKQ